MSRSLSDFLAAGLTLAALATLGSCIYLKDYIYAEFQHQKNILKIENCRKPLEYNLFLESFVSSEHFIFYFNQENYLDVYRKLRIQPEFNERINLDNAITDMLFVKFLEDSDDLSKRKKPLTLPLEKGKTRELVEILQEKKEELLKKQFSSSQVSLKEK